MNILHITPHLSTGGLPEFLYKIIKIDISNGHNVSCLEYKNISNVNIVQKNKIQSLLGGNLLKNKDFENDLDFDSYDVIYVQEFPELFMDKKDSDLLYKTDRSYKLIEGTHDSSFDPSRKQYFPDYFAFISKFQIEKFKNFDIPYLEIETDIRQKKRNRNLACQKLGLDPKIKHILNVGIVSPRKNQRELLDYAKALSKQDVMIHSVGGLADNFKEYYRPILNEASSLDNLTFWGERDDVDLFYQACDLFLFTSKGNEGDRETKPLVLREAISYNLPIFMYDLKNYLSYYDSFKNIQYLKSDKEQNCLDILTSLDQNFDFEILFYEDENKYTIKTENKGIYKFSFRDINSGNPMFSSNLDFRKSSDYWVIPCGKNWGEGIDSNGFFSGFYVEVYNIKNSLLKSVYFPIKEKNDCVEVISDPFISSCVNYYQFFIERLYDFIPTDINTVVDIGANAGISSDFFIEKGAQECYLIDGDLTNVKFLKRKYKDQENIKVIHKVCSGKDTDYIQFFQDGNTTISSIENETIHSQGTRKPSFVENISLARFLTDYNLNYVDLVKIDIEGAEYELISNTPDSAFSKIKYILLEMHSNKLGEYHNLIDKMSENFEIVIYSDNCKKQQLSKEELTEGSGYILFCENKDRPINIVQSVTYQEVDSERHLKSYSNVINVGVKRAFYNLCDHVPLSYPCLRPTDVNSENEASLTGRHFGCFSSIRRTILDNFDKEFLLVMESDSYILDLDNFKENLKKAQKAILENDIHYFSFAGPNHFEKPTVLSPEVEAIDDFCYITNQCYYMSGVLLHKKDKDFYFKILEDGEWDTPDLFFKHYLESNGKRIGITREPIIVQCPGPSLIDRKEKTYENITY